MEDIVEFCTIDDAEHVFSYLETVGGFNMCHVVQS